MSKYFMSIAVLSGASTTEYSYSGDFGALLVEQGNCVVNGVVVGKGEGTYLTAGDQITASSETNAVWIQFELSRTSPIDQGASGALLLEQLAITSDEVLLRLDQVDFPPGATAFRHVHPGDGIRYLSMGELEIISDDHQETARAGHAWFEPANSPVRAVACMNHAKTSFVRFMVLPVEYAGKPTIQILDADDAAKPRLQVTHRHFDKVIQVASG